MKELYEMAVRAGFDPKAFRAGQAVLKELAGPCILLIRREAVSKFVVYYGHANGRFVLGDPTDGVRLVTPSVLASIWANGVLMTAVPRNHDEVIDPYESIREESERYRCFGVTAAPLGSDDVVIQSTLTGRSRVIPSSVGALLLSMEKFDSLGAHADSIRLKTDSGRGRPEPQRQIPDRNALIADLKALANEGFLVSESSIRNEIGRIVGSSDRTVEEVPKVGVTGVPTCGRCVSFRRALLSYIANCRRFEREMEFVVADDSADTETCNRNVQVLKDLAIRHGASFRYLNRTHRLKLARLVAEQASVPEETVRFALLGHPRCALSYGANRNALLLETAGGLSVQVDDDTVCELRRVGDVRPGVALTSEYDASEYRFYRNRAAAFDRFETVEADFYALHEKLLGRRPSACLAASFDGSINVDRIDASFLKRMSLPNARIAATFAGCAGDIGMSGRVFRLFSRGATFERLVRTKQSYLQSLRTRDVVKTATEWTISDGLSCVTVNVGLDTRSLMPPFMPSGRNEDGIFSGVLKTCFHGAMKGYLPGLVLAHDPPENRSIGPTGVGFVPFTSNDFLLRLILSFDSWPGTGAESRLQALGRFLEELARLHQEELQERLRAVCIASAHVQLQEAERRLETDPLRPPYWVKDVEEYVRSLRQGICRPESFLPSDLAGAPDERVALLRELIHGYGKLLYHWPKIVEAAEKLRESDAERGTSIR